MQGEKTHILNSYGVFIWESKIATNIKSLWDFDIAC